MFVFTVKWQNVKFILSVAVSVAAIVLAVSLIPKETDYVYPDKVIPAVRSIKAGELTGIDSNEKRVALLKKYGREVISEPQEIKEVIIPEKFDSVYKRYNELQISEGFDLAEYKGDPVKRYTYVVTNEEYDGTVYANLLIYKGKVIGGDVSTASSDGFVKGLSVGNDFLF